MERRVLRRAADQALLTSMTQGPDSAAAGQPGGAPDQDFQYTRSDPTDTDASYDHEPVTAPIPVTDVADELPVGSVEVLPEPVDVYDVYDLVPDQPDDSGSDGAGEVRADGDAAGLDVVEAPEPVVSRPLRARPLGEDALVHPAAAMPMPEFRPQPWYRSRQAATLIAAAAIVAVVGGGWLMVRSPSTTAEQSKFEAPTSAPPAPSTVAPTAVSAAQPPPAPPPPPPPPPPTAEPVYSGPQRQYSEPRRSVPPPAQKPEIGETRTPATRAPISVAPVPRPVAGSGSNTPGEQPRRRGCFGFC